LHWGRECDGGGMYRVRPRCGGGTIDERGGEKGIRNED